MSKFTQVLASHHWSIITHRCRCDYEGTRDEWPQHVEDAVAAAGLAVIQLPDSDRGWATHDAFTVDEMYVVAATPGGVILEDEESVTAMAAATAKRLAAALLAAIAAAEAVSR